MPFLDLDDAHRLFYRRIDGAAHALCLVFLHEGLGCTEMWKGFPEALCEATGCRGVVYDRLGHGLSGPLDQPRTVDYLHDYALRELPAVIEALVGEAPFVLVGHSDGGSIGLIYAAERRPCLEGLITEAAHVFVEPESLAGIEAAETAWQQGRLLGLHRYHGEKTDAMFSAWSDVWRSDEFRSWNIEPLLSRIDVPILAIQGIDDRYGTPKQIDAIVSGVSGSVTPALIDNCGHSPHEEARAETLALMTGFVRELISTS